MRVNTTAARPVKIWASQLEEQAERQALNIANMPFIHKHVALMPDAHLGKGSTVGAVIATKGAIIPAAVGVDIGCGMSAVRLGLPIHKFDGFLNQLRSDFEACIPVGFHAHSEPQAEYADFEDAWSETIRNDSRLAARAACQLGTMGGGNHFLELCRDEDDYTWLVLHSGSRGIGKSVADVHIGRAKGLMKSYFLNLPDPDLAFFAQNTWEFQSYINDMEAAQQYAWVNRRLMMRAALRCVGNLWGKEIWHPEEEIDCHHNYTTLENHFGENVYVTRKGAVCARAGVKGIIPGSMGTRSYIVEGLGNADSFHSCAHGAGRRMSRSEARKTYTMQDFIKAVEGVECRHHESVIDEIPMAYKDIDQVMADQVELARPIHTLKQVLCVKG